MGSDNVLFSKPGRARFHIAPRAHGRWVLIGPDGRIQASFRVRDHAMTARDHAQARADAAAKWITRDCMCCRKPFMSEGVHNRLCGSCRNQNTDGWNPYGLAPRSGRAR